MRPHPASIGSFFWPAWLILPPTRSPLSGSKSPRWFQLDGTERWVDCLAANSRRCGSRWILPPVAPNKRLKLAARVAAALIRFEQVAAYPMGGSPPPGALRVGIDAYVFMPSGRRVPRDQVE